MTPFHTLTKRGQIGRLRNLAVEALGNYDLVPTTLSVLHYYNNATFRLRTDSGDQFVLRINRPGFHGKAEIRSEVAWITSIRRETGISTPEALFDVSGSPTVSAGADGVPQKRDVVIYKWIFGRFISLSPRYVFKAGMTLARLHEYARTWRVPSSFQRQTWDADIMLYGEPGTDGSRIEHLLTQQEWCVLAESAERFREATDTIGMSGLDFGLIHSDYHHGNFLSANGKVAVLDFDDFGYGHFAYDIAVTLSGMMRRQNYADLRAAFLRGYRSVRDFPKEHERHFGCMVAMRWVLLAVWKAGVFDPPALHGNAQAFAKERAQEISDRGFHKGGVIV